MSGRRSHARFLVSPPTSGVVRVLSDAEIESVDRDDVSVISREAAALGERIAELSKHVQDVPVGGESMQEYQHAADDAHRKARRKSHLYFLRKVYRFPPRLVVQQLATFVRNRLAERGLARPSQASSGC